MGTSDVETQGIAHDDDDGFQYGAGSISGIRARVRLGCRLLAREIKKKIDETTKKTKSIEITVDVFGFSRGAAAARNFVYEITKGEYTPNDIEVSYTETIHHPARAEYVDYSKIRDNPYEPSEKPKSRIQHYKAYTTTEKKKKKVKRADSDGLMTNTKYHIDGKLPRMGHLGYSLLKLNITPEQLEKIELKVRFLGIYDTVSSYEEWGPLGGDSHKRKGAKHIQPGKSLFNDDVKQLNLNTLRCTKIVHFTAMDEHRENFDLTRITGANAKDAQGNIRRIEKSFPGVHCDIGGAYENGREYIDEIEVVNKDISGLHDFYDTPETSKALLEDFSKKLIKEYWYEKSELIITLKNPKIGLDYSKLSGTRKYIHKEYSYIPLHFMKEYSEKYMKNFIIEGDFINRYKITDKNLIAAKKHLTPYVKNENNKEWKFIPDEVFVRKQKIEAHQAEKKEKERELKLKKSIIIYDKPATKIDNLRVVKPKFNPLEVPVWTEDQKLLRELRNKYFHWSANREWLGMDPNDNRKRKFH
jgi:hypothetical protein